MIGRISGRILVILLAAGLVAIITVMGATHEQPKPDLPQRSRLSMDPAVPGGAEAVRRAIADMRRGPARDRQMRLALGPLQTLDYSGADRRGDIYTARFQNGSLLWTAAVGDGGKISSLTFDAPRGPTPQDWIDWFALLPTRGRVAGQIFALIKLLVVIGFGRIVGIRL